LKIGNSDNMTGGLGFSRQASDSFKQNRSLRNKRKPMSENPYSSHKMGNRATRESFNLKEFQKYRAKRNRKSERITIAVLFILLIIVSTLMALTMN